MSDEYTRPQLKEIAYFDATLRIMKDYTMGEGKAKPREEIWNTVITLWPRDSTFNPPTRRWCKAHHSRYRRYCARLGFLVLHCRDGIFIAETPEEAGRWDKFNEKWLRGIQISNKETQKAIGKKGYSRELLDIIVKRLLGSPDEEMDGEEE